MRVFVFEYFTGGLAGDIDHALLQEGAAMLRAALRDFAALPGVSPFTVVDARAASFVEGIPDVRAVSCRPEEGFAAALDECGAALVIAPETGGELARLAAAALHRGKLWLGCGVEAIHLCGDKLDFAARMKQAGIPHPATWPIACFFEPRAVFGHKPWLTKPRDGTGAGQVALRAPGRRIECSHGPALIAQEYVDGEPMSVSVVSSQSECLVLSVNRQFIEREEGGLVYAGGEVLSLEPPEEIGRMTQAVWRAVPGLTGYWGIDFIATPGGAVVIEVNPRLTTSYTALGAALDINPARAILSAAHGEPLPRVVHRRAVTFSTRGVTV